MNRLLISILRIVLPLALLLAQHGVWAHGFAHDNAKIAAHGQAQDHATHACCLPFQAAGDAASGALYLAAAAAPDATVYCTHACGHLVATHLPYSSRAPPATS